MRRQRATPARSPGAASLSPMTATGSRRGSPRFCGSAAPTPACSPPVGGWAEGTRRALEVVAAAGARPSGSLDLGPESVVLVTGGARGITAQVSIALAKKFHCRLELVGRSPLPIADEDPAFSGALDRAAL